MSIESTATLSLAVHRMWWTLPSSQVSPPLGVSRVTAGAVESAKVAAIVWFAATFVNW